MQKKQITHRSLEKALEILLAFRPYNREIGTVEISEKLGFHKSTASRLFHVLETYGFVNQDPRKKKYILGRSVIELGLAVNESLNSNLTQIAKPCIDDLRDRLKETIVLEVVLGRSSVIGYIAEGPGPIRIKGYVGDRRPVHAAAGAKAILAFSSPEMSREFLMGKMRRLTPNTITDPVKLRRQLEEIRKRGFAFDNEEVNIGINAIGAPIFNHEGNPVAAVVVAGLSQGITWEKGSPIVSLVKHTAALISEQLYYRSKSNTKKI